MKLSAILLSYEISDKIPTVTFIEDVKLWYGIFFDFLPMWITLVYIQRHEEKLQSSEIVGIRTSEIGLVIVELTKSSRLRWFEHGT